MTRKDFLKYTSLLTLGASTMTLQSLNRIAKSFENSPKMPVLFIGHGNPMNAITDNKFKAAWIEITKTFPKPNAILCISAHWLTDGTFVTMMSKPKTIHDFGGFPNELYQQQYPAPGAVEYASMSIENINKVNIQHDFDWGFDHGTWCVLKPMYPEATIPVFQLSLDYGKSTQYHYELGQQLSFLRTKGVLIIASGNVVHNLGMMSFADNVKPFDWAVEFDTYVKENIDTQNDKNIIEYTKLGTVAKKAHPTNDHYLPLLYAIALREKDEKHIYFNDSFDLASMSMRCVKIG